MEQHDLHVPTISCGHCVSAISTSVRRLPGVASVTVDVPTRTVRVTGDVGVDDVRIAIGAAGYQVAS